MNSKEIKTTKTEIESIKKELSEAYDAVKSYKETTELPVAPDMESRKCPHCSAKPKNKCKTSKGYPTHPHTARKKLFNEEWREYQERTWKYNEGFNKLHITTNKLEGKLNDAKKKLRKQEEALQFLNTVKRAGKSQAELVVECGDYQWLVVRARNLVGLRPGSEIPNQDAALTDQLMKRGVDVTLVRKDSRRVSDYPMWGGPSFRIG